MSEPSGKIVARPLVARACGCKQEFQHYAVDKYRAQRLAKFQKSRCPACVAKLLEEQRQGGPPPEGGGRKLLPPGTQVSLTLQPDGVWAGTLAVSAKAVKLTGTSGAGPQAVIVAL